MGDGTGIEAVKLGIFALLHEQRVRNRVVVQTRNVPEVERQSCGRLLIGSIKHPVLGGVLIGPHIDVKRRFDGRNRGLDEDAHGVARAADDGETGRFGELHQRLIVLLGRAKPLGELGRGEELAIVGAGRVIEFAEEIREASGITERQDQIQSHRLGGGEPADRRRLTGTHRFPHVVRQNVLGVGHAGNDRRDGDTKYGYFSNQDFSLFWWC